MSIGGKFGGGKQNAVPHNQGEVAILSLINQQTLLFFFSEDSKPK